MLLDKYDNVASLKEFRTKIKSCVPQNYPYSF